MFKTSEEYYEYFDKTYLKSKDQVEEFYGQDYQQVKEKTCKEYFNGLRENKSYGLIPGKKYHNNWIALEVDQKTWEDTDLDVPSPGVYLFFGMWHGDDPLDPKSCKRIS